MLDEQNPTKKLLSREEVLGGLGGRTAKQASTTLALIENRTEHRLAESRQAASRYMPAISNAARAQSYLDALAQERTRTHQPTIRQLERYATQWAELVPANPTVRAGVAHLLGEKYRFSARVTGGIRAALGLDTPTVQAAYQQQYGQPLVSLYARRLGLLEQVRWGWARLAGWLENLSPFWTAFALTLTEIVGAGILALPIALARIGPLAGVAVILLFGLINLLTLSGVVEAITRNGSIRYGSAYFGRLTSDYLGPAATITFSLSLLVINLLSLVAYYVGIATTLAAATGIPNVVWVCLLFACALYVLRGQSLDATVASALVIGLLNIALIFLLILLTLPHVTYSHLTYLRLPWVHGQPWDASLLGLVFGTIMGAYFGHTSVGNMAKTVLRRDPSGRTLLWGNVAAMVVAMLLYALWIIAVNGAVAPEELAQTSGTALIPLAALMGPVVHLIGALFMVLGMGMASIHYALALFNQVQEWLPSRRGSWLGGERVRLGLGLLPVTSIFCLTLWLLWTGRESFTGPYSFMGAIVAPLLAGIFPLLLLIVSRRRGEYVPGVIWRWLGHPLVVMLLYLIFFTGLFVHGLLIWSDPLPRAVALLTSLGMLVLTGFILRGGVFTPYTVIELRVLPGPANRANFQVVAQGQWLPVVVQMRSQGKDQTLHSAQGEIANLKQLDALGFQLPATTRATTRAKAMLKVWVHSVSSEGDSVGLPARVSIVWADRQEDFATTTDQSQITAALSNGECQVKITLG